MKIQNLRYIFMRCSTMSCGVVLGLVLTSSAMADPIQHVRTETFVDWTSAGTSGVGGGDTGTINLAGVSGPVGLALLYWHGIGDDYDSANVSINGNMVTGTLIGTAPTNCWGSGNSKAYRADVTTYVSGDGSYFISGMRTLPNSRRGNGVSLVVTYDDGNAANDRDLVFLEGNDSNFIESFPGEDSGWHANVSPINYGGGSVSIELL